MIPLTITETKAGKKTTRVIEMPCLWEELTLKQFMQIIENAKNLDEIMLLSILTGLSPEYLANVPANRLQVAASYAYFMSEAPPDFSKWKRPDEVTIQGKQYKVPEMRSETFGQKIYIQNEVNRVITAQHSTVQAIPYSLAIYFYTAVTGDKQYDEAKMQSFIPVVMGMKVTEAIPTANFFLTNCVKSLKRKESRSHLNQLKNKHRQGLRNLNNTESQTQSTHSLVAMS